jgi:hypothetical protein
MVSSRQFCGAKFVEYDERAASGNVRVMGFG